MYDAMSAALDAAEKNDDIAAHVFIGSGGVFTAGNDINDFVRRARDGSQDVAPSQMFIQRLPKVTRPMVAAVDGLAIGVGVTLLLHCDLVYATPAASFRTPFVDLGLIQEAGSSLLGPARLGHARAFELFVLGEAVERRARRRGRPRQCHRAGRRAGGEGAGRGQAAGGQAARRPAGRPAHAQGRSGPDRQDHRRRGRRVQRAHAQPRSQGSLHGLPGEAAARLRQGAAWGCSTCALVSANGAAVFESDGRYQRCHGRACFTWTRSSARPSASP